METQKKISVKVVHSTLQPYLTAMFPKCSPGGGVVYIQKWLVQVGQVQVVLGFVVLSKCFILWRGKLTEWCKVCIDISNVEAMRLVEVSIPRR